MMPGRLVRRPSSTSILLVQRHAHERTQDIGFRLAKAEFSEAPAISIAEGPFPRTLRRCFELAVERDMQWTVTLDGDVLLLPGAGDAVRRLIPRMPVSAGHADLLVRDRVHGRIRSAGVRLYRTSTMRTALSKGDWSGQDRPEYHLLQSLRPMVEGWSPSVLVGIHDYEQYLRDLFRTAFVTVHKFAKQRPELLARWASEGNDEGFALLAGGQAAVRGELPFAIDAEGQRDYIDHTLAAAGLKEREPLTLLPEAEEILRHVPRPAHRLRRVRTASIRFPRVWLEAGKGRRGLPLARYAFKRTLKAARRR